MDVIAQLHADIEGGIRHVEDGLKFLKTKYNELVDHLGADAAPVVAEAEHDAATVAKDAENAAGAAVAETVTPSTAPPADAAAPTTPAV